jgi:hypothetical protein
MNDLSVLESPSSSARCWRINYETNEATDATPAAILREPCNRYAMAHEVDINEAMEAPSTEDENSLLLVWLPRSAANVSGAVSRVHAVDAGMRVRNVEAWVRDGQKSEWPFVRASIRTILVLWSGRRAVIYAALDEFEPAVDAVVRFTMAAWQTLKLERQVTAAWTDVEMHVALTHSLSSSGLRMQSQVNDMTELVTRMKVVHLRLLEAVHQLDPALTLQSKLLFSELALQAELPGRLERLEDPLQFLMDHYELSNTRLIEDRFNRRIIWLEAGIVVIIAADFFALTLELFR